MRRIWWLLD